MSRSDSGRRRTVGLIGPGRVHRYSFGVRFRAATAYLILSLVAGNALGCTCDEPPPAPEAPEPLAPLSEPSWRVTLPVEGYGDAVVAVPLGAREPRRVVVALHGDADRPEWQCGAWRGIAGSEVFVLCPRGVKRMDLAGPPRFTFGTLERTEQELRLALKALKQRYGKHVAPGEVVLTGLGVGATRALQLAKQEPAFFSRLVVIEGDTEPWTAATAAAFASRGGKRILFGCAHAPCEKLGVRNVLFTRRNGGDARLVVAGPKARGFDAHFVSLVQQHWAWLIGKDPAAKPSE